MPIHDSAKAQVFSPPNVPCGLPLFVGLLSLFYRELPKLALVCVKVSTGIVLLG